jgi:VanZ family protein
VLVDFGGLHAVALYVNQLPAVDKAIHFCMFGLLALLANATLLRRPKWRTVGAIATGSIFAIIVSTVEEWSNLFVAYRTWSLSDLAANYLGILCLGTLPLAAWQWKQSESREAI